MSLQPVISPKPESTAIHLLTHEFAPFRGGIGVYVEETALAMAAAGFKTTVWAPDYGKTHADPEAYAVRRLPMRGRQDWFCRAQLAKALREAFPEGRIDGTVVLAEPGPVRMWMYHRLLRLPQPDKLVVVLHGTEIRKLASIVHRKRLFGKLLADADCVGVVSQAVGDMVEAHFPGTGERLVRVPGAVRDKWRQLPSANDKVHLPVWHVLQVGRISPRKGQLALVEAIARLPAHLRNQVRVRLVGPVGKAAYAARIQARARELDVPVHMVGALDDDALRDAYHDADVVVMPSQPFRSSIEGLGIALLEGAHFGCPVIGTRLGGIPEAMQEGKTGLLVPPEDTRALAAALERIFANPDLASRMGEAGARFVREHFCWQRNVSRLLNRD